MSTSAGSGAQPASTNTAPDTEVCHVEYSAELTAVLAACRAHRHMPDDAPTVLTFASVMANRITGLAPSWLAIVAPPSSGKTSIIDLVRSVRNVHVTGAITEAGLLSGSSARDRASNATGGLLRQIGERGVIAIPDFGAILAMRNDKGALVLQALRQIHDGYWKRDLGTDGGVALEWRGHLGVIAAATPVLDRAHSVLQALGDRFLYVRVRGLDPIAQARAALRPTGGAEGLADMVAELIRVASTDGARLDDAELDLVADLAALAVRMRSATNRDGSSREVIVTPEAEAPARLAKALAALAAGMCAIGVLGQRRMALLIRVALDSMPEARRRIVCALFATGDRVATDALVDAAGVSYSAVDRHLHDLCIFGAVTVEHGLRNAAWYALADDVRGRLAELVRTAGGGGLP